jgi:hypothetical protein
MGRLVAVMSVVVALAGPAGAGQRWRAYLVEPDVMTERDPPRTPSKKTWESEVACYRALLDGAWRALSECRDDAVCTLAAGSLTSGVCMPDHEASG